MEPSRSANSVERWISTTSANRCDVDYTDGRRLFLFAFDKCDTQCALVILRLTRAERRGEHSGHTDNGVKTRERVMAILKEVNDRPTVAEARIAEPRLRLPEFARFSDIEAPKFR